MLAWLTVSLPAFAQTTSSVAPGKANDPVAQEEPPPGGCMPIGITAAGETVFPYVCKGFIEAHKGKSSPQASETRDEVEPGPSIKAVAAPAVNTAIAPAVNSATASAAATAPSVNETGAPTVEEKAVAKPDEPAASRTDESPAAKRDQRRTRRAAGAPPNCAQFRTFDSVTGMYRDFTGQTRPCVSK
jgi:hypothetical protein